MVVDDDRIYPRDAIETYLHYHEQLPDAALCFRGGEMPRSLDWHDAKKRSFAEQASMLKELGYEGVGHIWLDNVAERLKTLDEAKLKLFQITMTVDLTPGKPAYDAPYPSRADTVG